MAGGGFGGGDWGGGPWGSFGSSGGLQDPGSLSDVVSVGELLQVEFTCKVTAATSVLAFVVQVDFNAPLDTGFAENFDSTNYSIPGLTVIDAIQHPTQLNSVLLLTSEQQATSYTLTVSPVIQSEGGDVLDPAYNTATFLGTTITPTVEAVPQSSTKLRLTFLTQMNINADFLNSANYTIIKSDGTPIGVTSVSEVEDGTLTRSELILSDALEPLAYYALTVDTSILSLGGEPLDPNTVIFRWAYHIPAPIQIEFQNFSGEVSGGLLGTPAGQVFISPAYEAIADSIIEVDSVDLCTRAYDVYTIPSLPDPAVLYTYPPPASAAAGSVLGTGAVLFGQAHRLGLAKVVLNDLREDTYTAPADGPADAILVETIDITRASFLNDDRWRTYPGTGASLGVFMTADNTSAIGPGPTDNISLQS